MNGIDIGALRISTNRRHVTMFVAIDTSCSMRTLHRNQSRLQVAAKGACKVVDKLHDGDHAVVMSFGDEIHHVTDGIVEIDATSKNQVKRQV